MLSITNHCYLYASIIIIISSHHQDGYHDPLSTLLPIIHCFRQIFRTTSRIGTELLYVSSSWSSCLCTSTWRGPLDYIPYELFPTSPAVSRITGSSNLDSFRDGWSVAVQLVLCGVLPPWKLINSKWSLWFFCLFLCLGFVVYQPLWVI